MIATKTGMSLQSLERANDSQRSRESLRQHFLLWGEKATVLQEVDTFLESLGSDSDLCLS